MRKLIISIILLSLYLNVQAQELKLNVQVNSPRLQLVDPKVFETLESEVYEFFNNTKFTEDEFEEFEKIEGNININITEELSPTAFKVDVMVQSIRPVYNSNYKSQVLNFNDRSINVIYQENQPIQNSFNNYIDPLSSLLTYYAYMILGFDYDSFTPYGGDEHFKTARLIADNIPRNASDGTGWDPASRDNMSRFNIIEELQSARLRPFRQALYEYHLKSLDNMAYDANKSRAIMMSALTAIEQVNKAQRNTGVVQMFCDSKRDEIVEIFKGAPRGDQTKVYNIMSALDPARASTYSDIK